MHIYSQNPDYVWDIWRTKSTITCHGAHLLDKDNSGGYYPLVKTIQDTCHELKKKKKKKHKYTLKIILLSCPGGDIPIIDISGIMALYKSMDSKLRFDLYCVGEIASAATIWAASAEWNKIYVYSGSKYVIHPPCLVINDTIDIGTLNYRSQSLKKITKGMAEIYSRRSHIEGKNKSVKYFIKLMKKSKTFDQKTTPEEMVEMGLVTKIY
jgi:ATP-dependent protease ClpP protease subunit